MGRYLCWRSGDGEVFEGSAMCLCCVCACWYALIRDVVCCHCRRRCVVGCVSAVVDALAVVR